MPEGGAVSEGSVRMEACAWLLSPSVAVGTLCLTVAAGMSRYETIL